MQVYGDNYDPFLMTFRIDLTRLREKATFSFHIIIIFYSFDPTPWKYVEIPVINEFQSSWTSKKYKLKTYILLPLILQYHQYAVKNS